MKPKMALKQYRAPIEKISNVWVYFGLISGIFSIVLFRFLFGMPQTTEEWIFFMIGDVGSCTALFYSILNGRQKKAALYFGISHDILLATFNIYNRFYASAFYYMAISFPLLIRAIATWNKNSTNTTRVSTFSKENYFWFGIIFVALFSVLYTALYFLNGNLIVLDALSITLNCFATYFTSKRSFLQWPANILTNVVCMIEYGIAMGNNLSSMSVFIANIIYTINAVINLFLWRYQMKKHDIYRLEFYQN